MFNSINPTIEQNMASSQNSHIIPTIIILVIAFLIEICIMVKLLFINRHIKRVLLLLMHCPPDVVLNTPKIMAILSGDFSKRHADSSSRDSQFFESVVRSLPDAVIIADNEMNITSINMSFIRIFNVNEDEFLGTNVKKFIEDNFKGEIQPLFSLGNNNQNISKECIYQTNDGTEINLAITCMVINQQYVFTMRDVTQTVRYNNLIRIEKEKSDSLLASILPPNLVARVQKGEKNISFAVQSATIVFMDIVEFTPWCGSLPADKVMSTLNLLFKKFDSCCAKYETMTKIKCIGDCYMGAGGVFSEVNQPAVHAKEVVSFGLDAIDTITEINGEINESLRIRVGVNTGGPIVAGVLGVGKPTFEILGPAINMAQQMEHHGVPMQVHISRLVYELIYGDQFVVKERGQIEVKNGKVTTYLVTGKK